MGLARQLHDGEILMPPSEATYVLQVEVLELADVVQRLLHIALVLPTPTTRTMQSSVGFGKNGSLTPSGGAMGTTNSPPASGT